MTNTDSLPTWDEIFANLADEVERYDENIRRLNALTDSIND